MLRTFVLASDAYLRCLPAFVYCYEKHIGEVMPLVVACYQHPAQIFGEHITVHSIGEQKNYTFSAGLRAFLQSVNDPVFLLVLEDYLITGAQWAGIRALADYMAHRRGVGRIDLTRDLQNRPHRAYPERINGGMELVQAASDALYQFSLQASLWRRDFLLHYLDDKENPWQCEKGASKRIIRDRAKGVPVPLVLGARLPMLAYVNAVGGEGKRPEQWDRKKFPDGLWNELQERGLL